MLPLVTVTNKFILSGSPDCCKGTKQGMWVTGDPKITINGLPMVRVGMDIGLVSGCCCPTATAVTGSNAVLVNGAPAHTVTGTVINGCGQGMTIQGVATVLG